MTDEKFQKLLNTVKKYIEDVIGTIKHDGHLGSIQTDLILPDLEKALAEIGTTGCPAGLIGTNGLTDENFNDVFELLEQNAEFTRENNIVNQINSKLAKENEDLKSQLQQQALPVVPECVGELFNEYRLENIQRLFEFGIDDIKSNKMIKALMWRDKHPDTFSLAFITGKYEVEKPQLFYIDLPKVFGLSDSTSDSTFVSKAESGIISEFTKGKDYALKLTEQEIKSIDERYWQFAVPVEDGE